MESAGYSSYLEPKGLDIENLKRPDGRSLVSCTQGKPCAWDFTCCDTLASPYVMKTSKKSGQAADIDEKRKIAMYEDLTAQFMFYPVLFTTE